MDEIAPRELQARLLQDPPVLVDVREDWEFTHCRLQNSINIPLSDLPNRWRELDPRQSVVAICHHGLRSHYAAEFLRQNGFKQVLNLTGGIDQWAAQIETEMPRY